MLNTFADTQTQFERHALAVLARAEIKPLTGIQEYAIDLYERGFNPFPIPSAHDWNSRNEDKKPYILTPLFYNRLHYVKDCECSTCRKYNFITLFEHSNLAIMCGATSGNLLSVDCDTQEQFKLIGEELTKHGLVFPYVWAFTSHKGGSYLLRVIEGVVNDIPQGKKSIFDDVQIWGNNHFVIVPPSIHSKGTTYKWLSPEPLTMLPRETLQAVSIESLDWLGVTLKKYSKSQNEDDISGLPEFAKDLSLVNRNTLKNGAKQGGRNRALCDLSCDLVGNGWNKSEVESALLMAADNCEPPYPSEKNDTSINKIIEWAFSKERNPSRKFRAKVTGEIQDWQRAQAFANSYDWYGNFGGKASYARRVYYACIERSRLDSRNKVFRASAREIAKLAKIDKETASVYLRMFTRKGLLKWQGSEKTDAYKYSFIFGEDGNKSGQYLYIDSLLSENVTTKNNTLPFTDEETNAFHGLGAYAFPIWRELCACPAKSYYEIAKRLSIPKPTVKRTVIKLETVNLVEFSQSEKLFYGNQLTDAQLEIIATNRGTQNKAQERRQIDTLAREKNVNKKVFVWKAYYNKKPVKMLRSI